MVDRIWHGARLATMAGDGLGIVDDGVVACTDGRIVYAGPAADAPVDADDRVDCAGRWITPGLIDCHTHLVHGGNRAAEFALRLEGASYQDIARAGGGIVSTMRATRAASEDDLVATALPRIDALIAEGVTTVEVKSGYGLSLADETRMLRAARRLGDVRDVRVATTFLGAHAVPPEFAGDADGYIDQVCDIMIPAIAQAGLADAVDAFCEGIGFTPDQTARVFAAAARHGLRVKLHAEQLSALGGASLAARHAPCRPITWSMRPTPTSPRWRRRGRSRCCCPAPIISCARPCCRRLPRCARRASRSRWRPIAIPARRR